MALRSKITKAVDTAFAKVGDLAETVTLKITSEQTYNFGTGSVSSTTEEKSVTAIVMYAEQDTTDIDISVPRKEVLIKEKDLAEPKRFDKVSIQTVDHSIISYKVEPGLVTLLVTEV